MRVVLQDALSEVMMVYPLQKFKVFVDDITAFMEGRNKEKAGIAWKVLKSIKGEVEEKGLKLSFTGGRRGKGRSRAATRKEVSGMQ